LTDDITSSSSRWVGELARLVESAGAKSGNYPEANATSSSNRSWAGRAKKLLCTRKTVGANLIVFDRDISAVSSPQLEEQPECEWWIAVILYLRSTCSIAANCKSNWHS